jgi:hypothetical protein
VTWGARCLYLVTAASPLLRADVPAACRSLPARRIGTAPEEVITAKHIRQFFGPPRQRERSLQDLSQQEFVTPTLILHGLQAH